MRKILAARNQSVTGLRPELLARLLASEKVDMQWHRNETVAAKMATPKFCGKKPGPVGVAHGRQVLYYFLLMFPLTLFKFLALETNRYGNENCAKKKRSWKETSITELVHWIGILILMGMHVLPARADYWDVDGFLHNSEIIATMTLGRFRNLCVFFHACNNNDTQVNEKDKLYKIRTILDAINANFQRYWNPMPDLAIDEGMVAYKGTSPFKVYMPAKPTK